MTVIPAPVAADHPPTTLGYQPSDEQLQDRARRFGVQSKPAEQPKRREQPFTAGINLLEQVLGALLRALKLSAGPQHVRYVQAEVERRQQRAQRFHTQGQGLAYSNAPTPQDREEAERGRRRAERFGLELHAEPTGQAEAGQCLLSGHLGPWKRRS